METEPHKCPMAFHQHYIKLIPVRLFQSCGAQELYLAPCQGLSMNAGRGRGDLKPSTGHICFEQVSKILRSMNLGIVSSFVYFSVEVDVIKTVASQCHP